MSAPFGPRAQLLAHANELLGMLAPVYERDRPAPIGELTADYLNQTVFSAATKAQESADEVVNGWSLGDPGEWPSLLNVIVLAKHLVGTAAEDDGLDQVHALYELLEAAITAARELESPVAADEHVGAAEAPPRRPPAGDVVGTIARLGRELIAACATGDADELQDPHMLVLLRDRAKSAASFMWSVEKDECGPQPKGWDALTRKMESPLFELPVLEIATENAIEAPNAHTGGPSGSSERWWWCMHLGRRLGEVMVEWAEGHRPTEVNNA